MFRKLRRLVRVLALLPGVVWIYQRRHQLAGALGFAKTVPDRLQLGRGEEAGLAAKATLAMLREPALRGADVRLGAVQEGSVVIEVGPGADAAGEAARRAVERLPEVTDVRLEAKGAHPSPQETEEDQPTTSGPTGGPAGAPAGGTSGAEAVTGEAVAGDTRP